MAKGDPSKALKPTDNKGLAVIDYGDDAGAGFENQTREDITIPFISVLQGLSPQLETVDGAKPGLLFNTVTGELFPEVCFVPAVTNHVFVEWKKRNAGGGFVAVHSLDSPVVTDARANQKFGEYEINGNDLIETYYVYGVLVDGEEPVCPVALAFTSTKIKAYKKWNTSVNLFMVRSPAGNKVRPPLFAHLVKLGALKEKNAEGEYYVFSLTPANGSLADSLLPVGDPRLEAAKNCRDMIAQGLARADYNTQSEPGKVDAGGKPTF